jgi:hypothetical protein
MKNAMSAFCCNQPNERAVYYNTSDHCVVLCFNIYSLAPVHREDSGVFLKD